MNEEKPYVIVNNGIRLFFNVTKNICEPCSECGRLACGREFILWYEEGGNNIALIFDGSELESYIEEYLSKNMTATNYSFLPKFIRECNEVNGWTDSWNLGGVKLDMEDFLKSIQLLIGEEYSEWLQEGAQKCLSEILQHIHLAKNAKKSLWIIS